MKKEMFLGVIFLVTAIIFVSSTPVINNAFAKKANPQDDSGSKNYENFLNCLSGASGSNGYPAGDQIVNCFAESGYIQGSSSASNTADSQDKTGNVDVNALHDNKNDKSSSDNSVKSSSDSKNDKSSGDSKNDKSSGDNSVKSSSNDNVDSSSNDNGDSLSTDNGDSSSNNSFIDSAYDDGNN
ncbi:MAG TPA: hypothetical protein VJM74_02270 [Nitrososphaeraceae archaeon]|nr:hypothetical protein [Nitrososphaeraceae archaeon]